MTHSGAAAATAPEPEHGPGPVATADDVIPFSDLKDRERQLASTGACAHPVKLHGRVTAIDLATGEAAPVYDTASEPGGVLHVLSSLTTGSRNIITAVYDQAGTTRQMEAAGVTLGGSGVPFIQGYLREQRKNPGHRYFQNVRAFLVGGSPRPPAPRA